MNKIKTAWITAVIIALCAGMVPGCGQSGAASAQASAGQNTDAEDTTVVAADVATTAATPETEPGIAETADAAGAATAEEQNAGGAGATAGAAATAAAPGTEAEIVDTEPEEIYLDPSWTYAEYSEINSGAAVLYRAAENRKNLVIGVNAGHGTEGGVNHKTYCHPDQSPKTTGGSTSAGAVEATAVSTGMSFHDGTPEHSVTLEIAQALKDKLLEAGYDVLMLRDGEDVQLDNIARTVISNNVADCHIAIHFDGDGQGYDKGAFYISVPEGIKDMDPVDDNWESCDALGENLIDGLEEVGVDIFGGGSMAIDLTQTSYSTIPSVDIELGNQASDHSEEAIDRYAEGLLAGVELFADEQEASDSNSEED
ncbi:MAG: N-acetylmuramoyl-L-alanine amidase [Eubacteriales bacterium]|nr:N-acetylmuramoyl-L-alanine amidase [Eubacteriales bacterium]